MTTKKQAVTKYVRISPQKARLAAALIRGLQVEDAARQLVFSGLKGGKLLKKTLDSAVANAESQTDLYRDDLYVLEVRIDKGPSAKRVQPANKGRRHPIEKRTSHFTVVVGTK